MCIDHGETLDRKERMGCKLAALVELEKKRRMIGRQYSHAIKREKNHSMPRQLYQQRDADTVKLEKHWPEPLLDAENRTPGDRGV